MAGKPVFIFGRVFPSIRKATKETGIPAHTLGKRLDDPTFPEVRFHDGEQGEMDDLNEQRFREKVRMLHDNLYLRVSVFGKVFSSVMQASRETGVSHWILRRRLYDPDFPEVRRHDGRHREEDGASQRQFWEKAGSLREKLSRRPVSVLEKVYPSASQASRKTGIPVQTIRYRIRSRNFPEYRYLDGYPK